MKKRITRIVSAILTCVLLISLIPAIPVSAANNSSIKQLPDSYTDQTGSFTIMANSRFLLVSNSEPTAEQKEFAQFISQQFAGADLPSADTLPIVWGPASYAKNGDIILEINYAAAGNAAESYKITVNDKNIHIIGADNRGLMYGAFMVIKTMRANGSKTISGCTIQDTPDAAERTVMLDCGRKYFTAEWLKNYIKEMAYMGYNTFEMHFAEDQGFRLNIWDGTASFASPNGNNFSWACGGMVGSWVPEAYWSYSDVGKYLTAKEMVEILEVAKQYQIDVIPSFDTPMHCQYLRRAWSAHVGGEVASELGNRIPVDTSFSFVYNGNKYSSAGITNLSTGKTTAYDGSINVWKNIMVKNNSGVRSDTKVIDVTNAVGRNLMLAIIEDYAAFFKQYGNCTEYNICADEVAFYTNDYQATYAQDVLKISNGTKYDTFTHYVNEATNMLQDKYGYKVRIFSDFVDRQGKGGSNYVQHLPFDEDLEIVYWWLPEDNSYVQNVTHFVNNNYKIYNAVENYNYYVLALYNGKDDRGGVRSTWSHISAENVWNHWNPTVFTHPTAGKTNVVDAAKVAGGYFLIWCDYGAMNTEKQIWNGIDPSGTYNVIERMWSNVTKMWNYDINTTSNSMGQLTYANFKELRVKLGDFPGYADNCSAATSLPAAKTVTRAYLADHTALKELLAQEHDGSIYNQESWSNYETARAEAVKVDENYGATAEEISAAYANLQTAIENLSTKTYAADHSKLVAELEKVFNKDSYKEDSWNDYETARNAAQKVHENYDATQEQVDEATENLKAAIAGLKPVPFLTIQHMTMVGDTPVKFAEEDKGAPEAEAGKSFTIEVPGRAGYDLVSVENCSFIPYDSGADGGYITGYFTEPATVIIWYTNMPETKQLENLTKTGYDSTTYSEDSWKVYEDAVAAAEAFLTEISASPSTSTHQEQIQKHVAAVLEARNALQGKTVSEPKILDLKVPAPTVAKGKKAILVITTTTDVKEITIDGAAELTDHYSQPAVANGQAVKLWYITFRINEIGTKGYTVHAGSAIQTVEITCK